MISGKLWKLSGIFLLLAVAASCGTGSTTTTPPPAKAEFLYAITISGQPPNISFNLSSFKVDTSTGTLTSTATIALTQPTLGLAVDPGARFLYVSSPDPLVPAINIYSINATTGVPTPAGGYLLTTICIFCPPQSAPGSLALNPNGKFLYYGSITLGAGVTEGLGTLATGPTGALSAVTGSPLIVNQAPFLVAAHPSGKFVYAENLDPSVVSGFTLQGIGGFSADPVSGALTEMPLSPFPLPASAGLVGFAVHPSGKFLYVSTGLSANGILGWSIDSTTGQLTVLSSSPSLPGTGTFGEVFDPTGKFLYVSAGAAGGILGFSVDSNTGALTPLPGSPFASSSVLNSLAVDPAGQFLFGTDILNKTIAGFRMNATSGNLTSLGGSASISAGAGFMTIVQAP